MKTNLKNIFGAGLFALAFSVGVAATAAAESCAVPPTCDSLGYTKTASDCQDMSTLKCPFDTSKVFCVSADELPSSNCAIGDILYSDKTCNANVVASKTAIGVVFDATNRLAIAKDTVTKAWMSSPYEDVTTLTNITSSSAVTANWQGKSNTATIVAYCNANSKTCPAFDYVISYSTAGTHTGDWYLPAGGELNAIYGNKDVLNTALNKIGGTALPDSWHWSSSEYSYCDGAWYQYFSNGNVNYDTKYNSNYYVRPVLAF